MGYTLLEQTGRYLARLLTKPSPGYEPFAPIPTDRLLGVLEPGDIILVEGHQYLSSAIKYLTMSTWSHAAMYVGEIDGAEEADGEPHRLIEVLIGPGCITAPLSKYDCHNIRICRPVGLTPEDRDMVVTYMRERIGLKYDLKNVFDLLRYLFPTPHTGAVSQADDRAWVRRSDASDLLDTDRAGVPACALSDPAEDRNR